MSFVFPYPGRIGLVCLSVCPGWIDGRIGSQSIDYDYGSQSPQSVSLRIRRDSTQHEKKIFNLSLRSPLALLLSGLGGLRSFLASPAITKQTVSIQIHPRPLSHTHKRVTPGRRKEGRNILPILQIAVPLRDLRGEVDGVAREQQVVLGLDGEGVAHEGARVDGQRGSHLAGDAVDRYRLVCTYVCIYIYIYRTG